MKRVPLIMQMSFNENGMACLAMVLAYHKKFVAIDELRKHGISSRAGTPPSLLCSAAGEFGLDAKVLENQTLSDLKKLGAPFIVRYRKRSYAVVRGFRRGLVYLNDPYKGSFSMTESSFLHHFTGVAIVLSPSADFEPGGESPSLLSIIARRYGPYKKNCAWLLFVQVMTALITLMMLNFSRVMMDEAIVGGSGSMYILTLGGLGTLLVLQLFTSAHRVLYTLRASRKMTAESGSRLYKQMLALPARFFEEHSAGDILNRINTNSVLDLSFMRVTLPRLIDVGLTFVYLSMLYSYSPPIATLCLVVEVAYILLSNVARSKSSTLARSVTTAGNAVTSSTLNGLSTIETIKSMGAERDFFAKWVESATEYSKTLRGLNRVNAFSAALGSLHHSLSSMMLLFVGAALIIYGDFTLGMMAAFQSVLTSMRSSLTAGVQTLNDLQNMRVNLERVDDMMNTETVPVVELKEEPHKLDGSLEMIDVCFKYSAGDAVAASNISLKVEPGQMVALVGPSGCGKSTILKMLSGAYRPMSGRILYDGRERSEIPDVVFTSSIGVVEQEATIVADTIYDSLKLWDETIPDSAMVQAAKDAQIHERIMKAKNGYDAHILESGRNFSGGELQRLELARALAQEPTLLLLDEFTSALDAFTEQKVFSAIREQNITCVLAAHRYSTVMLCDVVVVVNEGRIVEMGSPDELYRAQGLFRQLVDSK